MAAEKFDDVVAKRVPSKNWPKIAYKHKLCIRNWPDGMDVFPGPAFEYKALRKRHFAMLLQGYFQNKKEGVVTHIQPIIQRWSQGNVVPTSHAVILTDIPS